MGSTKHTEGKVQRKTTDTVLKGKTFQQPGLPLGHQLLPSLPRYSGPATPSPHLPRVPRAAVPALSSIRMGLDRSDLASASSLPSSGPQFLHMHQTTSNQTTPGVLLLVNGATITGESPLRKALPPSRRSRLSAAGKTHGFPGSGCNKET